MQLSKNQKMFFEFFLAFPKSTSIFENFGIKDEPQRLFVSEILDCKMPGYLNG